MQLYPAIDLKDGQCVRLKQGEFKEITVYSQNPEEVAALWQSQGATFLHLVDLDGALAGRSVNDKVIKKNNGYRFHTNRNRRRHPKRRGD